MPFASLGLCRANISPRFRHNCRYQRCLFIPAFSRFPGSIHENYCRNIQQNDARLITVQAAHSLVVAFPQVALAMPDGGTKRLGPCDTWCSSLCILQKTLLERSSSGSSTGCICNEPSGAPSTVCCRFVSICWSLLAKHDSSQKPTLAEQSTAPNFSRRRLFDGLLKSFVA